MPRYTPSHVEPHDDALGRSRSGWRIKQHPVTDGRGVPLAAVVTDAQNLESKSLEKVTESAGRQRAAAWPEQAAAHKGYNRPSAARWLANHQIVSVIPHRSDQIERNGRSPFHKRVCRGRSVGRRCVNWLTEHRRLSARYDKLADSLIGFVTLAFIRRNRPLLNPSHSP